MNKTTHLLGGVVAAQLMNRYAGMPLDLGHSLAVVYAATIPDFDTNNSAANKPSDLLPFGLGDLAIFRPLDAGAGLLGAVLSTALKHRGPLHYPATYAALLGVWWIIANAGRAAWLPISENLTHYAALAAPYLPLIGAGLLSHLVLDSQTQRGVAPLAPFTFWKLPRLRISTGTWQEGLVAIALCAGSYALWRW